MEPRNNPQLASDDVIREHAPFVERTLRRMGVRPADLEDVMQDVFIVVHRRLPSFEGRSSLHTWLYGICRRVAWQARNRAHVRRELAWAEPPQGEQAAEQARRLEERQQLERVQQALSGLSPGAREVFVEHALQHRSMLDIANMLGCPLQTAYSRYYAARRVLQRAA